nr:putative integron gene cassette protein [uncultured bacterium]
MPDTQVSRWTQQGTVFCWRYLGSTGYPGWNLTPDEVARRSLLRLVDLMLSARFSSSQTVRLARPPGTIADIPRRPHYKWSSGVSELHIHFPKDTAAPDHWLGERQGSCLQLKLGERRLQEFREGFEDVIDSDDEWAIGPDNDDAQLIYFRHLPPGA